MAVMRMKPGAIRKRVAARLLSGRPEYDPEKGECWIVISASLRSARRGRRSGQVRPCGPKVDVIGIDPEPGSIQQALMTVYAIGVAIGTLSEEGNKLLGVIERESPDALDAMKKWVGTDRSGEIVWPKEYPADHPYHG